jgi:hypothetical protein
MNITPNFVRQVESITEQLLGDPQLRELAVALNKTESFNDSVLQFAKGIAVGWLYRSVYVDEQAA